MKKYYFEIKATPVGRYFFSYKTNDSLTIAVSSSFINRSCLEACISKIRSHASCAPIIYDHETYTLKPLFVIKSKKNEYSFILIGFENEIIMQSETYTLIDDCIESIHLIKETAMESKIIDLT